MTKLRVCGICLAGLIVTCCATANIYPSADVKIQGSSESVVLDDARDVATALGFVWAKKFSEAEPIDLWPDEQSIPLERWEWSERRSTSIEIARGITSGNLYLVFADPTVGGFVFDGATCTKYLEFVSAMKAKFDRKRKRLEFSRESCARN